MPNKLLSIALAVPGTWDAGEAASILARVVRSTDRSLDGGSLVQLPWLDGSRGTLDFLVTNALGSFLEVEATGASGEDIVAPLGFAGEDGKLAVIEMARVTSAPSLGAAGTTAGIGELIEDALDEGAFSIVLCHEEPLVFDAGFGAAAALGVRFFDASGEALDFAKPGSDISHVERIDLSARSFSLLSSRLFIARSHGASEPSREHAEQLERLAGIVHRDAGVPVEHKQLSASAVELGLCGLLGAEVRNGLELVLEASRIPEAIERGEISSAIIVVPSEEQFETAPLASFLQRLRDRVPHRAILVCDALQEADRTKGSGSQAEAVYSLAAAPLFQAPLRANASAEERSRDLTMRLEKMMPKVLAGLQSTPLKRGRNG